MATEQLAKKDAPDKPSDKKKPVDQPTASTSTPADQRDSVQKEKGRIEQSAGAHLNSVQIQGEDGSKVTTNEKNQVTKVVDAKNQTRELTYDAKGGISSIKDKTGTWTTTDGKHWTKEGTHEERDGTASVSKDGTFKFKDKDGKETTYDTIGSQITRDAQKNVVRTQDVNGHVREFAWGEKGLTQIKDETGTWNSKDGVNWRSDKGETAIHAATVNKVGTLLMRDSNSESAKPLDGNSVVRTADGVIKVQDGARHVVEIDDAKGHKHKFGYGAGGKINQVTDPDGTTWKSKDGQNWSSNQGKSRTGEVTLDPSGTLKYQDENKANVVLQANGMKETRYADGRVTQELDGKVQETHKAASIEELTATADAIRKATGNDNWVARWADKEAINNLLKDKNEAERKIIDDIYRTKHGHGLDEEMKFLTGSDKDKFENIFHKKDGDINSQDAGRIHEALLEHQNSFLGRSHGTLDQDIRDSLSTKRADEIQAMDKEYQAKYGTSMRDAIMKDPNVSKETKDLVDVYLKGNDKRTDDDVLKLAHIALQAKDTKAFEEVMKEAPESARQKFRDQGGDKEIQTAFGADHGWGTFILSSVVPGYGIKAALDESQAAKDIKHSLDLAKEGKIDAATQINDNAGVINWTTNDKGVESAIGSMTDAERSRYMLGKKIESGDKDSAKDLNDQQKQEATAYYDKMHTALTSAGGDTAVKKWEDMIEHKGGSLVSKLAAHKGTLWNDSSGDIARDVENMDKSDWERLKPGSPSYDPAYRKEIEDMLHSYKASPDVLKRCSDILDAKQKAGTFEESQTTGRSSILDTLEDKKGFFKDDQHGMLEAISKMTPAEQEKYRTDPNFRKQVDAKVADAFADTTYNGQPEVQQAAQDMLAKVARGEKLNYDIVANLEGYSADFNTDHAQAVRDIEKAFKDDPKLRDRINNPQTPEDKAYAAKFNSAAREALGDGDYEKYVKPLVTTGHLDIDTKLQLDKGFFKNDHEGAFKDITSASPDELKRLQNDPAYREKTLGFLGAEDRKIAQNVIDQGKMNPEDQLRQNLVHWGGSSDIMDTLRDLKEHPDQLDKARTDYAKKYGTDLEADLLSKLSGEEKHEALGILHNHETAGEQYNDSRDQYYRSRDGFGSKAVEYVGHSGTGYQLDEAMANYRQEVSEANKNFAQITPEKKRELEDRFQETLKNFKESKAAAADYVVDGVVAGAAIASLIATGGADAPLLLMMAAGGAAMKVGAKKAFMGDDYDGDAYSVGIDCASGAINGITSVLGPGECAAIFKVGECAAMKAATATTRELAEQGLKSVLKEGGEEALQKGTAKIMQHALASGADKVDQKAIQALAEKTVAKELTGAAREKAVQEVSESLSKNLTEQLQKETAHWLTNLGREVALNAGGGALGGGGAGTFQGLTEWDPKISVEENLARVAKAGSMSALSGGVMGGGMTVGMKVLGHGFAGARRFLKGAPESAAVEGAVAHDVPGVRPAHAPDAPPPMKTPEVKTPEVKTPEVKAPEATPTAKAADVTPPGPNASKPDVGIREAQAYPQAYPDARDEIAPGQALDYGRTIIRMPKDVEVPAGPGDKVLFNGDKYTMGGADTKSRYVVISKDGPPVQGSRTPVSASDFKAKYSHMELTPQGTSGDYLVRDVQGKVFKAYSDKSGYVLESMPQLRAVERGQVALPPINGPENVQFDVNGKELNLENGRFRLGRGVKDGNGDPLVANTSVSASHGEVTWDRNQEKYFYRDAYSTNGSEIKKAGSNEWTPVARGGKVEFAEGDQIRLAGKNDSIVSMKPKLPKEFPDPDDVQLFVDNKPVQLRDGQVNIGRGERVDGHRVIDDSGVSNQHATVRYDAKQGAFYYKDTSSNGTFIKREGAKDFEFVPKGKEVRIGAADEIHLARPNGPEVKLVRFDETKNAQLRGPGDVAVSVDGKPLNVRDGEVRLGRNQPLGDSGQRISDLRVSRDHGSLRWDSQEKSLVYEDHSMSGTYLKRDGSDNWEFIKSRETKVGVNDEIRLGSTDGPQVKLSNANAATSKLRDNQAFFGGKPLDMSSGSVEIGRKFQSFSNNEGDALNKVVSKDHGTLTWNKDENAFYYKDHSENGTYIKRADSNNFVRMPSDVPVKIGPYDQVRLGGDAGPELKLTQAKGEPLDNGRVRFQRPDGVVIKNADGSEVFNDGAGIRLSRDPKGKVVGAVDARGVHREYAYNPDGSLNGVKYSTGEKWEQVSDNSWKVTKPDGEVKSYKVKMSVEPDGSIRAKGQSETVQRLDGSFEVHQPNGRVEYQSADLATERTRLNTFSDRNFSNIKQKQRFDQLMSDFQTRAEHAGLSDNEIALTYHQVNRLMQAGADAPLSLAERVRLSEQIMHETAYPDLIDQGQNPTCNVATVENRIFTRQPDKAAQLIVDVATTGRYTTADGTLIDLTRVPGGLRPDAEAARSMENAFRPGESSDIKIDRKRNWAGQIFENTAANVKWARTPELHSEPGDVLLYTKPEGKEVNRLMRYSVGRDGKLQATEVAKQPKISTPELTDIHNQITGGADRDFAIVGPGAYTGLDGQAQRVNNVAQFENALRDLKQKKNFPAILLVDARNEPFAKFIGSDGNTEAWHVVNIQDIRTDPRTGKMMVDFTNQWGEQHNHLGANAVPADVLFEATKAKVVAPGKVNPNELEYRAAAHSPEEAYPEFQPKDDPVAGTAGDGALDKPREVQEVQGLPRTEIKPKDELNPVRIKQVSAEIAERFREKPMTSEQFSNMFSKMSDGDRKIALELMEDSAGNMNSRALDGRLQDLAKKMDANGAVTIYTLGGDTSGNPLAYLFRKNNPNLNVEIKILDESALREMSEHAGGGQSLIFDDLSHATAEQKAFLAKQKGLTVADMGGFDKGMNLWDFGATKYAGPELMERKLAALTTDVKALMQKEPNLSMNEAVERVTSGDTAAVVKEINPDAKVVKPDFSDESRVLRKEATDTEAEAIQDLYREFTEPMVTQQQIADFLGGIDARQQAAAAIVLRDGTVVNTYSTMMDQMRNVQKKILAETGARPEDLVIVHSFDKDGSAYLVNSLYGKVNGLDSSQYMSLAEVKAAAKGSLKGKVLVYLDDVTYSGKQAADNITENANAFKQSGAQVAVGTLGAYEVPADKNYWTLYQRDNAQQYQQLKRLNPKLITDTTYKPFYSPSNPNDFARIFAEDPSLLQQTAGTADWSKSSIDSSIVLPYGGPNNNIKLLNDLLRRAGIPGSK